LLICQKTFQNYRLQYEAIKSKLRQFPKTRFIVWTAAALVEGATNEDDAKRAREFVEWVRSTWDEAGDNIYLWDFHSLETEGGLYLKSEFASGPKDSHPNDAFSRTVAPLFCKRIVEVLEGGGDTQGNDAETITADTTEQSSS
jgi:hypothetical protein